MGLGQACHRKGFEQASSELGIGAKSLEYLADAHMKRSMGKRPVLWVHGNLCDPPLQVKRSMDERLASWMHFTLLVEGLSSKWNTFNG